MSGYTRTRPMAHCAHGFTVIELMIVVVIVAMLATLAFSSYQSQVRQTRRSDGKAMLSTVSQQLERCFTRYQSYAAAGCDVAANLDGGISSTEGWYVVTNDNASANTYRLVATPQGVQVDDTNCANLRLTHTGVRDATGSSTDRCW